MCSKPEPYLSCFWDIRIVVSERKQSRATTSLFGFRFDNFRGVATNQGMDGHDRRNYEGHGNLKRWLYRGNS